MKFFFQLFTSLHVGWYRLTGGKLAGGLTGDFGIVLLTTTGRKSGHRRTSPLGAFKDGPNYIVIASNGGQATHPGWYHNIKSNPQVELEVNAQRLLAVAEVVGPDRRAALWKRLIELSPAYNQYTQRTTREIPLILLKPVGA